jgi:geranylgeranylglycerol-phosphate geranylgeranyltransferase
LINGAFKLIRPLNTAITMAAVYAAGIISAPIYYSPKLLIAVVASAFVAAFGNIINDIFDLELDRKAKPFRPLPSGEISITGAKVMAVVCALLSLILSILISNYCLLIASIALILLTFYTPLFKGLGFWGNFLVAIVGALAFFYGAFAVGNPLGGLIPALFAFLFHFIREIIKDMEDFAQDREFAINTGVVKYGFGPAKTLALIIAVLLIAATLIPFLIGLYKTGYLLAVVIGTDIPLIYIMIHLIIVKDQHSFRFLSGLMKALMLLGLLAIFLGSRGI